MPIEGKYEPSTTDWVRNQVDLYERSGGAEGTTLRGMPVVILASRGATSGKIRKTPLMRVEHDGRYAVVASQGGAPTHPRWYFNLIADPHVELRDGAATTALVAGQGNRVELAGGHRRAAPIEAPLGEHVEACPGDLVTQLVERVLHLVVRVDEPRLLQAADPAVGRVDGHVPTRPEDAECLFEDRVPVGLG